MEEECGGLSDQDDGVRWEGRDGESLVGCEGQGVRREWGSNVDLAVEDDVKSALGLGWGEGVEAMDRDGCYGVGGVGGAGEERVVERGVGCGGVSGESGVEAVVQLVENGGV